MQYLYVDEDMDVNLITEELFNETKPQPGEDYGAYIRVSFRLMKGEPRAVTAVEQYIDNEWVPVL